MKKASSGEQFIAVRRDSVPGGNWCADCPTDVNINAEGVQELANAAIENLSRHKPNMKHVLRRIVSVQRQAQVRIVLSDVIIYNNILYFEKKICDCRL